MSRRPGIVYALFAACLVLAGLGASWLSWTAIERDHAETHARRRALFEENVRLALWRIDSEIATLIATENARPYFDYSAFRSLSRAYADMVVDLGRSEAVDASPLLSARPKYVRLHFQLRAGTLTSPQVPDEMFSALALKIVGSEELAEARAALKKLSAMTDEESLTVAMAEANSKQVEARPVVKVNQDGYALSRRERAAGEFIKRSQSVQQASTYNVANYDAAANPLIGERGSLEGNVAERSLTPVWIGDELLLVRRVVVGSNTYVQGIWLDWATLRAALRTTIEDLLPSAELQPVRDIVTVESSNRLASLPLELIPGAIQFGEVWTSSGTVLSLVAVWMGFLFAGVALVVLVIGAMSLSERRAAFVSAVTHELRTPLTTFRMYTEMLAEGKVRDETKKQRYLDTLKREAVRLAHLVENVLAYSQIERGRAVAAPAKITTDELLGRMLERLSERALQADMTVEYTPPDGPLSVVADPPAVEQILFNLVDNACKYASTAEDRRIHLEVRSLRRHVEIVVWDHGPGIRGPERRTLFSPFSKSAQRAAISAPGVGLGLALSRRLAASMGATLRHMDASSGGARFALSFRRV